jgi:hypothetical protein
MKLSSIIHINVFMPFLNLMFQGNIKESRKKCNTKIKRKFNRKMFKHSIFSLELVRNFSIAMFERIIVSKNAWNLERR